jgi:predicted metal-dependent TIM-barrel fold hydrolase
MSIETNSPTVLDYDVDQDADRIIIGAERSDVSVVVETPREIDEEELAEILEEIPDSVAVVDEIAKGGIDS